jgi:hypothetical protein
LRVWESRKPRGLIPETPVPHDIYSFSHENILEQIKTAKYELGYYVLRFYSKDGKPSKEPTNTISEYYLYPTGGTLRDSSMNLIFYDPRYDVYRGFKPPYLRNRKRRE